MEALSPTLGNVDRVLVPFHSMFFSVLAKNVLTSPWDFAFIDD